MVSEGEKKTEAAQILFPDYVATTPMHGAQSPKKSDWSPVKGRCVIIATDYDEAGDNLVMPFMICAWPLAPIASFTCPARP